MAEDSRVSGVVSGEHAAPARVLVIVGPTAVGKSALAQELAVRLDGEIVSADSMQVYTGMDIGTAKTPVAARRVAHHCLDLVSPGEPFSAALYQQAARSAIQAIAAKGRLPIVCGGTGLYVRAAVDDFTFGSGEQAGSPRRREYEAIASERGAEALHELLCQRDAESAALIHPNNSRRVVRALEFLDEGLTYATQQAGFSARESVYHARFIGLDMDREALYARIDARVRMMVAEGLLGEIEALLAAGLREAITASQAIGYKEFMPVLEGTSDLESAIAEVAKSSRRYAKRQLTWFRADPRISWIDVTHRTLLQTAEAALDAIDWSAPSVAGPQSHIHL